MAANQRQVCIKFVSPVTVITTICATITKPHQSVLNGMLSCALVGIQRGMVIDVDMGAHRYDRGTCGTDGDRDITRQLL